MCSKNVIRSGSRFSPVLSVDVSESPRAVLSPRALLLAASRFCPNAPVMTRELITLQRRLGTGAELAGDQIRINLIALQLSRLIYAAFLLEDQEREGGLADDSASF